jgi:hypothetical protein
MNTLLSYITAQHIQSAYQDVKILLQGYDEIIFNAMAEVTSTTANPFVVPTNNMQYQGKYIELERRLNFRHTLDGLRTILNLFSGIHQNLLVSNENLAVQVRNRLSFDTNRDFKIYMRENSNWTVLWAVEFISQRAAAEIFSISVDIQNKDWGWMVPDYIVEYIDSAISAYKKGMNTACLALLSVSIEAVLRDLLSSRNYVFTAHATATDVYEYCDAVIAADIANNCYSVRFPNPMQFQPVDFAAITGNNPSPIRIRRKTNGNRLDLVVLADQTVVDHWSSSTISQPAQRTISGLGAALNIARNTESLITPEDLPPDFDNVIQVVRNNLIHLSGEALNTHLPEFDRRSVSGHFTLKEFLNTPEMVFDLLTNIPVFANEQYQKLRQNGHLIN